jgi:quercetin dioxygenase-like cupin family protein
MHKLLLVSVIALTAAAPANAKSLKWMDATGAGLPAGAQMAVVKGDPSKAADFVVQIKMPANYTVPPHHHPTDEVVRVVSGGPLAYGMGDKVNTANAGSLEKGYHITMQTGMNHWVVAPAGGTTVQVSAMGPVAIVYADPKDDPRGAK